MKFHLLTLLAALPFLSVHQAFAPRPALMRRPSATVSSSPPLHLFKFLQRQKEGDTAVLDKEEEEETTDALATTEVDEACIVVTEEQTEAQKLMEKVKDAGIAGVISYAAWEVAFWAVSVPVVVFGYYEFAGHWPDLSNKDDMAKLGAEAFAFVNFARFAVPLRIGLALGTTPWVEENIVERFMKKEECVDPEELNGGDSELAEKK